MTVRLTAVVTGHVQGVGFRAWTRNEAESLGLVGSATNRPDGTVHVVAEGPRSGCEQLLDALRGAAPGRVDAIEEHWTESESGTASGFGPR
jgi:acylphosphatase